MSLIYRRNRPTLSKVPEADKFHDREQVPGKDAIAGDKAHDVVVERGLRRQDSALFGK